MEDEGILATLPKELRRLAILHRLEGDFTYLQMEVVTFADLWERADVVVDFIERIWDTYAPFQTKLEVSVTPRDDIRPGAGRTFGLKRHWKKWEETRRLLLAGKVAHIGMYEWAATHSHCWREGTDVRLEVRFGRWTGQTQGHRQTERPVYDPREAKGFILCINTRVWDGKVSPEVQEQTVRLASDLFKAVDGACGFVNLGEDYLTYTQVTPYEKHIGMDIHVANRRRLCNEVRGAFWGNLLSARHVQALGGSAWVKQQAPCCKVIPLTDDGTEETGDVPLYLQTTPALGETVPEDYARLEAFLQPILVTMPSRRRVIILDSLLAESLGGATHLQELMADRLLRVVLLPRGALLVESDGPEGRSVIHEALQRIGYYKDPAIAGSYRQIPQLWSRWVVDDAGVSTLAKLIPPRPRAGPLFPTIFVQPCIPGNALEFGVTCAAGLTREAEDQLRKLVQEWRALEYQGELGDAVIAACSVPEWIGESLFWQADLDPVGQDAYFQLVMMLDEFSKTKARLARVDVGAWVG
jgi:hypothetical protein